jgi:hypothetical protein
MLGGSARNALRVLLTCAFVAAGPTEARAQDVRTALVPAAQSVEPDSTFTVEFQVIASGAPFNGFDAVVTYDPAALAFLPTSPTSLQQGPSMTGVCGSTFHVFDAQGDSLSFTSVLLCADTALTGPAQLYRLRFRATGAPQVTWVRMRAARFYDAGSVVEPVYTSDALVSIGIPLEAPGAAPARAPLAVRASPNPARGRIALRIASATAGPQRLEIVDALGRQVRRESWAWCPAGERTVIWDGRDSAGEPVPAGVYWVSARAGSTVAGARVSVVR